MIACEEMAAQAVSVGYNDRLYLSYYHVELGNSKSYA